MEEVVFNSQFNLLRAAIAMAYADGIVQEEEKEWLHRKFNTLPLKPIQRQYLIDDLEQGVDINGILPRITRSEDRDRLLEFANNVFLCDGYFAENEQNWYCQLVNFLKITAADWESFLTENPFRMAGLGSREKSDYGSISTDIFRQRLNELIDQLFHE